MKQDRAQLLQGLDWTGLHEAMARRIAYRTESQLPDQASELRRYLLEEMLPSFTALGFESQLWENPVAGAPPMLFARRFEDAALPTVLMYGHGDVVAGDDARWRKAASPWQLEIKEGRWYGRGSADNKGQHSINLAALAHLLKRQGHLGFNVKWLLEMGEEVGSPGLWQICERHAADLAADVFIASDGPRLRTEMPTLFLGSRGVLNFTLEVALREGAHHSGNWGGLLANPGVILASAIASIVNAQGVIQVAGLRPPAIAASVRKALVDVQPGEPGGPAIDPQWGEPGLSPAERVFAWNSVEVLAFRTGNPDRPVNAIPARAVAHMQLRFVVGNDPSSFLPALRQHLDEHGFAQVRVEQDRAEIMNATRLDPDSAWVRFAVKSLTRTTARAPVVLPNLGGSLPNECFSGVLGLPTIWVPHSAPTCSQHAPDEHLPAFSAEQGLAIMVGLFADLGQAWPEGCGRHAQG